MALYGIDISYWQRNNYKKLIDEQGKDFVIARAAFNKDVDAYCDKIYQYAKKQGKLLGFYFFPLNKNYSAVDHARWAYEQVKGYIGEAIPMLDWEAYRENGVDYVNVGDIAWAKAWLDEFYRLSGVRPMVYASASVINGYDWSSVAKDYGLWIAGYPNKYNVKNPPTPGTKDMPYKIGPWAFWCIWQYSSSAGTLDRDIANLTPAQWKKYAEIPKAATKPQEAPQPAPAPQTQPQPTTTEKPQETAASEPTAQPEAPASTDQGLTEKEYAKAAKEAAKKAKDIMNAAEKEGVKITLSNKTYDILKIVVAIVLPTISALYLGLANIWGLGFGDKIDATVQLIIAILNALLGASIVKSSSDYKKASS